MAEAGSLLWQCHPLFGQGVNGNAVVKHSFERAVRGGIDASALVRDAPVRHDDHLVGVQSKGDFMQYAHHRLALRHQ